MRHFGQEYWNKVQAVIADKHGKRADRVRLKVVPSTFKQAKEGSHHFTATVTKGIMDRDREVVLPSGIMLRDFDNSGAIHWMHDFTLPVGIGGEIRKEGDSLVAKGQFLERPADLVGEFFPDFARAFVSQMVKAGKQPGVSIGFEVLEARPATHQDKRDFGEQTQLVTTKSNLLEWSIASVPANPAAFVTSLGKSLGRPALKALFPGIELPAPKPIIYPLVLNRTKRYPLDMKPARTNKRAERVVSIALARASGKLYA
jgi:hypothetical protein